MSKKIKSVIFGCAGTEVSEEEERFFKEHNPIGFILFARNCVNAPQIKSLIKKLKSLVSHDHLQILIDQEGGRVARLVAPEFHRYNPASYFGELAIKSPDSAQQALHMNFAAMSKELLDLGINVNCAPVADLLVKGASDIIGNRSYGESVEIVTNCCKWVMESMSENGVTPIVKHIPGHGRALLDSHKALPIVDTSFAELMKTDFAVFKNLSQVKIPFFGMTAHIEFSQIDNQPATFSKELVKIIRQELEFQGILMTDDLSMEALSGSYASRVNRSFEAGCDLVLHCNGKMQEMLEIAAECPEISENNLQKIPKYEVKKLDHNIDELLAKVTNLLSEHIS